MYHELSLKIWQMRELEKQFNTFNYAVYKDFMLEYDGNQYVIMKFSFMQKNQPMFEVFQGYETLDIALDHLVDL